MRFSIQHTIFYTYAAPVSFGRHLFLLHPRESRRVKVHKFQLETEPSGQARWIKDAFDNPVLSLHFDLSEFETLSIRSSMEVSGHESNPFDFILEGDATTFPFSYSPEDEVALGPYIDRIPNGSDKVLEWLELPPEGSLSESETVAFLSEMNRRIFEGVVYRAREEEGIQDPDQTISLGSGSCRDMAHLMMAACRRLGLAARFVSGYLCDPSGGLEGFDRAAGAMHAWVEVYLPGAGWKGFDPTNGILADGCFFPCAVALTPATASPVQGNYFSRQSVASSCQAHVSILSLD